MSLEVQLSCVHMALISSSFMSTSLQTEGCLDSSVSARDGNGGNATCEAINNASSPLIGLLGGEGTGVIVIERLRIGVTAGV